VAAAAILPLLDLTLGRRPDRTAALLYAGIAIAAAGSIAGGLAGHGIVGGDAPAAFGARSLAHVLWSVSLQLRHLVWPDPLLARYFPPEGAELVAGALAGALILVALVSIAIVTWRSGRREVAFSLGAALLAYAPVSGLVPLSRGAADSYLYLSLALAVTAGARGLDRLASRPRGVARAVAPVALAALVLGLASAGQAAVWKSARTLWRPVARAYPDDPRALMRMGDAELHMGHTAAAMYAYEAIARRFPDFAGSLPSHALALESLGRIAEAEAMLARAVRIDGGGEYLQSYGFFLATHDLAPTDDRSARASLVVAGRLLAERGKRPATVERAARLLRGYGEVALAAALDRRRAELARRRTLPGR
jgi:tetratricopeptide (TPR) repeat protein